MRGVVRVAAVPQRHGRQPRRGMEAGQHGGGARDTALCPLKHGTVVVHRGAMGLALKARLELTSID